MNTEKYKCISSFSNILTICLHQKWVTSKLDEQIVLHSMETILNDGTLCKRVLRLGDCMNTFSEDFQMLQNLVWCTTIYMLGRKNVMLPQLYTHPRSFCLSMRNLHETQASVSGLIDWFLCTRTCIWLNP